MCHAAREVVTCRHEAEAVVGLQLIVGERLTKRRSTRSGRCISCGASRSMAGSRSAQRRGVASGDRAPRVF